MRKPSRSARGPDHPPPQQVGAVRRLAEAGEIARAQRRLGELKRAYPGFKPLYALAWEIQDDAGYPILTAARAWDWHLASPRSEPALQALASAARQAGLSPLQVHAVWQLQALRAAGGTALPPDPIQGHLGVLSHDEALAIDLSRLHLADGAPHRAVQVLREQRQPSARNNLALALFGCGDVVAARDLAEQLWREDADNLFALELAVRWRCWTEGLAAVQCWRDALLGTRARRPEDAIARVLGLRFVGDPEAALAAWREARPDAFWGDASAEQQNLWSELGDDQSSPTGSMAGWFPAAWTDRVRALGGRKAAADGRLQADFEALMGSCDAHVDYLGRACEQGDDMVRTLALAVLKQRASAQATAPDPAAVAVLTGLLASLGGPDDGRLSLLAWMNESGVRDPKAPALLRAGGQVREVRGHSMHVHGQPRPSRFDAAGTAIVHELVDAMHEQQFQRALELAGQLVASAPDEAASWSHLASVRQALGDADDALLPLLRRAHGLDPEYLFARCGLVRCLAQTGSLDVARDLIKDLHEIEDWHYSEYRSFLLAQRAMALAGGDAQAAQGIEDSLRQLQQEFD